MWLPLVAQLANCGSKLSLKLFTYSEAVHIVDDLIKSISNDESLTSIVLQDLYQVIKLDESRVVSNGAIEAKAKTVRD